MRDKTLQTALHMCHSRIEQIDDNFAEFLPHSTECQDSNDFGNSQYRGKYIESINSYHHQVAGKVYAVDEYTFLLSGFSYDGNGADTFFWAGTSNRPGPQGFIVPDEFGK